MTCLQQAAETHTDTPVLSIFRSWTLWSGVLGDEEVAEHVTVALGKRDILDVASGTKLARPAV